MPKGLPVGPRTAGDGDVLAVKQQRDTLTGAALRITITACQNTAALSPFPYQTISEEWGIRLSIGLDVSLTKTAICVVSGHGKIVREAEVASEP